MSLLCQTFQFIMQLFDMKTYSVALEYSTFLILPVLTQKNPILCQVFEGGFYRWMTVGGRLIGSVFTYKYLKTHGYIFFCLVIRQMEWEQFFWENEARQRAALHQEKKKKKSNKLFDSHNARIVSVIFSPAQCCWCGSGCWWHAENVLHSFLRELVSKSLGGFLILLHQNRTRSS